MIETMSLVILIASALVLAAIFTSFISYRFGAPLLLVFLLLGLIAGEDGLGLAFDNARAAYFIGSIALAIILFDSGFATPVSTLRAAAGPALVLATFGVLITAGLVGMAAHLLFGFSWLASFVIGAIVSSTDAAAVFFLLRVGGITLRERVRATLEVESGSNDPMAIFLTIALVGLATAGQTGEAGIAAFLGYFILQIGVGGLAGVAGGWVMREVVNRTELEPGLYPILVLGMTLALFALTGIAGGSGFLAVYVAGLVTGNARLRHKAALRRFNDALTWLSQIAMFLLLGLLATPSEFPAVLAGALLLAAFLMLVARPLAVWLCLAPFRFSRHEMAFVAWVGLRGAVSILLAILPMIAGLPEGRALFNIAFVVVLASLLVQGWSLGRVARWLGLVVPARQGPVERIELELPGRGDYEMVAYKVHADSPVGQGARIPRWARPSLIVRDGNALRPHRAGRPKPNDRVYILATARYLPLLDRIFARGGERADDPDIYGEFAIAPDATVGDVAAIYGASVQPADAGLTVRDFLRRELAGDIEPADRVTLGAIALIVRAVDEAHRIVTVGLSVEPVAMARPRIPLFQSPRELASLVGRVLARRRAGRADEPTHAERAAMPTVEAGPAGPYATAEAAEAPGSASGVTEPPVAGAAAPDDDRPTLH